MSLKLIPNSSQSLSLGEITKEQYLVIASEVVEELNWKMQFISPNGIIANSKSSFTSLGEEIRIVITNEFVNIFSKSLGMQLFDYGKNNRNINNFINKFNEIMPTFDEEEYVEIYKELNNEFVLYETDLIANSDTLNLKNDNSLSSLFIPKDDYYVTPILLYLNLLIFIIMVLSGVSIFQPEIQDLLNSGANFRPKTLDGEWWRLITSNFIHIGIFHILVNMFALIYIGIHLEPLLGRIKFISLYLATGIIASLSSLWWNENIVSAGASGSIFGMYGVFIALLTTSLIEKNARKTMFKSMLIFVFINLSNGINSNIDNAAHIGGLLSGIFFGYIFYPAIIKSNKKVLQYFSFVLSLVAITFSTIYVFNTTTSDMAIYFKKAEEFSKLEQKALSLNDIPENEFELAIEQIGLSNWNKCLKILNELEDLSLPEKIKNLNINLKEYVELRIRSLNYIKNTLKSDVPINQDSINFYNQKIINVMKKINN